MSSETVFHISFWFSFYLAIIINWGGDEILMIAFMGKWQIIEWNDAVIWTRIGDLINPNESVTLISLQIYLEISHNEKMKTFWIMAKFQSIYWDEAFLNKNCTFRRMEKIWFIWIAWMCNSEWVQINSLFPLCQFCYALSSHTIHVCNSHFWFLF